MTPSAPPRLARRLLRLIRLGQRRPEIEADLLELFTARVKAHGASYAKRRYWRDVASLWRRECQTSPIWRPRRLNIRDVTQDLAYAGRLMRRNPGVVAVTTLGLSVAIAVCTSVFSLWNAIAFQPSGIDDPASTARVFRKYEKGVGTSWSYAEFSQLRDLAPSIGVEALFSETATFSTTAGDQEPASGMVSFVTAGYLEMLNPRVAHGRTLSRADATVGAPPVVVLSHGMWKRRLGEDRSFIGRPIWLNGTPFTVIGVAERGFRGMRETAPDLWAPMSAVHLALGGPPIGNSASTTVDVVARIPQGVSRVQAQEILSAVASRLDRRDSQGERLTGVLFVGRDNAANEPEYRQMQIVFAIVMIVIGLVLLLACANVSNLLLASATTRAQEMGVRLALGASAGRIVRQLLTESVSLGVIGGASGLLFTMWSAPVLARMVGAPASLEISPDLRVYLFALTISLLAGVGAGLAPARHAIRDRFGSALRSTSGQTGATADSSRLRSGLIAVQSAASVMLIVLAALLTRATVRAMHVDVGFESEHLLTVSPAFGRGTYDPAGARAYWDVALERVRALPGVVSATVSEHTPFGPGNRVIIFGRRSARSTIYLNEVRADYFATMGLRVLRGRTFGEDEMTGAAPVAVISKSVAHEFYRSEDPIGQSLERLTGERGQVIIGIVADAITARLSDLRSPSIYQPLKAPQAARMIVRTASAPEALIASVRSALHPLDPRVRLTITPVSEGLRRQLEVPRTLALLASVVAGIAIVLAVVGIYGVTSFVVGQRTREIGLRVALGATGQDVVRLLTSTSLRPVALGLGLGLFGAMLSTRVLSGVLYGVNAVDPLAFAGATLLLLISATVAVIVPTRRAANSDPAAVLRQL
jgi:predicted permease